MKVTFSSFNDFKLSKNVLGEGTYGKVVLATHISTDKKYALKIINKKNL
jgi:serine/threonine protein kinase